FSGFRIYIKMPLCFTVYAIAVVQAGIEPLGRIGCATLQQDAIHQFIVKHLRIFFTGKIAVFEAPGTPAISQTVCHLFDGGFPAQAAVCLWYTSLPKILLG